MANKKVLVTSKGVYEKVDKSIVELAVNEEHTVSDKSAARLVRLGKAELVNNSKKSKDE